MALNRTVNVTISMPQEIMTQIEQERPPDVNRRQIHVTIVASVVEW
jgi:hypothetical protein